MSDHHKKSQQEEHEGSGCPSEVAKAKFAPMISEARVQAGFSLEGASMATRISLPFIAALESASFSELPGRVFARGFVRSLCKVYGVDPEPYLKSFEDAISELTPSDERGPIGVAGRGEGVATSNKLRGGIVHNTRLREKLKTLSPGNYLRHLPVAIGSVLLAAVIAVIYYARSVWESRATRTAQTVSVVDPGPEPAASSPIKDKVGEEPLAIKVPAGGEDAEVLNQQSQISQSVENVQKGTTTLAEEVRPFPPPRIESPAQPRNEESLSSEALDVGLSEETLAKDQLLELVVKEKMNLRLSRDGIQWVTKELEPKAYHLKFAKQLQIIVPNANGIDLSYNGVALGTLGTAGRSRRLSFKAVEKDQVQKANF